MTDDELLEALRLKRADPAKRIDMDTLPVPPLYPGMPATTISSAREVAARGARAVRFLWPCPPVQG